jgi:hypothetical protein
MQQAEAKIISDKNVRALVFTFNLWSILGKEKKKSWELFENCLLISTAN